MPHIHEQTPHEDYTIAGKVHKIPQPYEEGHALTNGEASQLNQVFAENIRNNMAAKAKAHDEAGTYEPNSFQTEVDAYCAGYEMGVRQGGGGRVSDPVEVEALLIAKGLIVDKIKASGKIKLSDVPAAKVTELAKEVLSKNPQIRETARANVAARQAIAGIELGSFTTSESEAVEAAPAKSKKA